jgi:CBS domain-containing protein
MYGRFEEALVGYMGTGVLIIEIVMTAYPVTAWKHATIKPVLKGFPSVKAMHHSAMREMIAA